MTIKKKTWPAYFEKIASGRKKFELRLADFKIKEGDILLLAEWDPKTQKYTGREIKTRATYVLKTKGLPFHSETEIKKYGLQIIQFELAKTQNLVSSHHHFPRGVEIVNTAIIKNKKGEILIARSPKWSNKWTLPGGHLEPGENLLASAQREAEEETGLKVKPIKIIDSNELINSPDFHRPSHVVYYDCLFEFVRGKLKLEKNELSKAKWVLPEKALKLDLADGCRKSIQHYLEMQ
ncbi:MAG: NUDIX domain-containing protein [Patescibacteria group bacterium]|nr:NUDIX domain-containing protein [Patescibacteria group bacterium]